MMVIKDRKDTNSIKFDSLKENFGRSDLIPMWVADMDFESPKCVQDALKDIVSGSVYGYNRIPKDYYPTLQQWLKNEQDWQVEQDSITFIPGIVKGIGYVINFFVKADEGIVIQPPVYPPFANLPKGNNRKLLFNPLIRCEEGALECGCEKHYRMDFDNLLEIFKTGQAKYLILCNPHNPVGISWSRKTLQKLADLCYEYKVIVISDEIHADMQLFGNKHIPFASVSDKASAISITFGAPSKTFNMAGIVSSYAIVPNPTLRKDFFKWLEINELSSPTIFATMATIAAYTKGAEWRKEMLFYITKNVEFVEEFFAKNIPSIKPLRPQSSFLIWLDCRDLCAKLDTDKLVAQEKLVDLFINKAKLALNNGATFGIGGLGYMRLNVGCGKETLKNALEDLAEIIK